MSTLRDLHLTTADYFAYLRGEASDRVTDICDEHRKDADFPWPDFLLLEVVQRKVNKGYRYRLHEDKLPAHCPILGRRVAAGRDCWCDDCPHATLDGGEENTVPFFKRYCCEV